MEKQRNIGGSLLPSGSAETYQVKVGKFGSFETKRLESLDTHGLYFTGGGMTEYLVATHGNGFSCDELAKRIIAGWISGDSASALRQFDYILACGGMGVARDRIEYLAGIPAADKSA
jgi:hypothetical protein